MPSSPAGTGVREPQKCLPGPKSAPPALAHLQGCVEDDQFGAGGDQVVAAMGFHEGGVGTAVGVPWGGSVRGHPKTWSTAKPGTPPIPDTPNLVAPPIPGHPKILCPKSRDTPTPGTPQSLECPKSRFTPTSGITPSSRLRHTPNSGISPITGHPKPCSTQLRAAGHPRLRDRNPQQLQPLGHPNQCVTSRAGTPRMPPPPRPPSESPSSPGGLSSAGLSAAGPEPGPGPGSGSGPGSWGQTWAGSDVAAAPGPDPPCPSQPRCHPHNLHGSRSVPRRRCPTSARL